MSKRKNSQRVKRSEETLYRYYELCGYTREETKSEGLETVLTDLFADLFHFCQARDIDFNEHQRIGYQHYCEEKDGKELETI